MWQSLFVQWQQRLFLTAIISFAAMIVLIPMASNTLVPNMGDIFNHLVAIVQAKLALAEGQFPLRISPVELSGWRYPFFQFYSPTSYTVAGFIYQWLTPSNPLMAYKLTIWLAMFLGGIYMYRLAYLFVQSEFAAILAAVVYVTSPYNIIVVNHLGAFNEALAVGILPLIIYYTVSCYFRPSIKTFLQTGIAWYVIATIHLITFMYTGLFVTLLLLLLTVTQFSRFKQLLIAGAAMSSGCALALWYLMPIVFLAKYFLVQNTFSLEMFHFFSQISVVNLFSPGAHFSNSSYSMMGLRPSMGSPILLGSGICVYAMVKGALAKDVHNTAGLYCVFVLFVLAFFMVWSPVDFWKWLPPQMLILQYTWRLLNQMMWTGALLFAWAMVWLFKNKLDIRYTVSGILLVMLATKVWLPITEINYLPFASKIQKHEFVYNSDSFVVVPQRYFNQIDSVDRVTLNLGSMTDKSKPGVFNVDLGQVIPKRFFHSSNRPFISIEGNAPEKNLNQQSMQIVVNDNVAGTYPLQAGSFNWQLPLTNEHWFDKTFSLHLASKNEGATGKVTHQHELMIQKFVVSGFSKPEQILTLEQVKPFCHLDGETTICKLPVAATVQRVELPILFYPKMLKITLNGKSINYLSMLRDDMLMAAIVPEAGKENTIEVQFQGLAIANDVSRVMWALAGVLFLVVIKRLFVCANTENISMFAH